MSLYPIKTASLRPDVPLGFDVYLLISDRHLLYVKRSDGIERERLERLRSKNVRDVFIDDSDRVAYEQFLADGAARALDDESMPLASRSALLAGQSKSAVEQIFDDPTPRENYERIRQAAANHMALLLKHPDALEHTVALARLDKTVYQHSVNVAAISIGLAASVGAPAETCNALGIGGLLHDIGKSIAPSESPVPLDRPGLEQHPRQGAGMLLGKKYVSRDVLDIILLHEERLDGKGYPAGVRKLDQVFQVVGLANLYDRRVTLEGVDPRAVYDEISKSKPLLYDQRLIEALKDVLVANNLLY